MQPSATLPVRQTKFSNGEISPSLYGDVSHPKWASSLRGCKNWLPIPQGALVNRPGTKVIDSVRLDATSICIPALFSDGQAFLLVLTDNSAFANIAVRFYKNGQYLGTGGLGAGAYRELGIPIAGGALPYLKFSQAGDTITITYRGQATGVPAMAPQDLTHTAGALWPWAIAATPLKIPAGVVDFHGAAPLANILPWNLVTVYRQGDRATCANCDWTAIQDNFVGQSPPNPAVLNAAQTGLQGNLYWTPTIDQDHPASLVRWAQTVVVQHKTSGVVYESGPSPVLELHTPVLLDRKTPIFSVLGITVDANYTHLYSRLFRATDNGLFGWISDSAALFIDDGRVADYSQQPPAGTDPFLINGVDSYPAISGYMDQRRLFGGSALIPHGVDLSRDGDFYNYDRPNPGTDTDALKIILASEKLEDVRSFAPMRRGIVLTGQGEWALSGPNGGAISKSGKEAKWQSGWGSGWLSPVKIGTGLIFCTAMGNMVRDFFPLYGRSDIWDGQELSFMARHLFDLFTITSWCLQRVPYPVVWAVRSDGKLLSLTYQHAPSSEFGQQLADGVCAWSIHDTGGAQSDAFESVCTVQEGSEDAVYAIVKRTVQGVTRRFIERMSNPVCPASPYAAGVSDPRYGVYLDSAVQYDGHNTNPLNTVNIDSVLVPGSVNPVDYAVDALVNVTCAVATFAAADAGGSEFVADPENILGLGRFKAKIVAYVSPTQVRAELLTTLTAGQTNAWAVGAGHPENQWGVARSVVANLTHLTGYAIDTLDANGARGFNVLADGSPAAVALWENGILTLQSPALVICAGLSYNCDVDLLDAHHSNAEIRNLYKRLVKIGFEVAGSRGLWAGRSFDKLWEWEQRRVADGVGNIPLATGYYEIDQTDAWDKGGQAVMRHSDPLPVTLTSVLREYALGGT